MNDHNNLELMNFRIPRLTKQKFRSICRDRNQMMTSVLNQLVIDFINEIGRKITNYGRSLLLFSDRDSIHIAFDFRHASINYL